MGRILSMRSAIRDLDFSSTSFQNCSSGVGLALEIGEALVFWLFFLTIGIILYAPFTWHKNKRE